MERVLIGFVIGFLTVFGAYQIWVIPTYVDALDKAGAVADKGIDTNQECLTTLESCTTKLSDATGALQSTIDTANMCVKLLWEIPLDELKEIRKNPMPEALPNVAPTTFHYPYEDGVTNL